MTELVSDAQTRDLESTGTGQHVAWYGATIAKSAAQAHGGTGSVALSASAASAGMQLNNWPGYTGVVAGTTYYPSAWAYKSAGPSGLSWRWTLRWRTSGGTDQRVDTLTTPLPSAGVWVEMDFGAVTAPTGATNIFWEIETVATGDTSTVTYFDDFTISDVDPNPPGPSGPDTPAYVLRAGGFVVPILSR